MKRIFLSLSCALIVQLTFAQAGFTIKAKIDNLNDDVLYLKYNDGVKWIIDSNYTIKNGWAIFNGRVDNPVAANIQMKSNPNLWVPLGTGRMGGPMLDFFLTNEKIEIKGDANVIYMADVKGGVANKEWSVIKKEQNQLTHEGWLSKKKFHSKSDLTLADLEIHQKEQGSIMEKDFYLRERFVKEYPNSIVSMYFLSEMAKYYKLDELKEIYATLGSEHKNSVPGKKLSDFIRAMDNTSIGARPVSFSKNDINGNIVNLESLRGKYVLLDFWGSWCKPCRASHPHLKELYAKYKKDGFEILGIANEMRTLEESRKAWKNALEEDPLPWLQVLNEDGIEKFNATREYGVDAFPTKILLDREGRVLGVFKGYSGSDDKRVDQKLEEAFGY